jgi:hypothetical protein
VTEKWCINCEAHPAVKKQRCNTCYMFLYRNGFDRPEEMIVEEGERAVERELEEKAYGPLVREARWRARDELDRRE